MLLRRIAHPLLASVFIANGVQTMLHLKEKAEAARPVLAKGQQMLPAERTIDPDTAVQIDAAVKIAAGLMLFFNRAPRLAATALAITLVPSTAVEHPFWSTRYPDERRAQQMQALKNAGLFGGLLLAILDRRGKPSLAWRAQHAREDIATKTAGKAATATTKTAGKAAAATTKAAGKAAGATTKAATAGTKATARAAGATVRAAMEAVGAATRARRDAKDVKETLARRAIIMSERAREQARRAQRAMR